MTAGIPNLKLRRLPERGRSPTPKVPAPSDRPRSTSPGWQVVGKGKRGPKGSPGKGKGGPSNDAPPRRVSFQAPVEQSPPQTQVEATLLAQLKALVTQCEATGTKGLLSKLKALAQVPEPAPRFVPGPASRPGPKLPSAPQSRALSSTPASGKGGGKSRKDAQGPQGQQSWAIDTKWWPGVLSSAATLDQSLEEGEEPGDNVAATVTLEQAKALMGLAKVHELKSKVALIIKDWHGPKAPEGLTATKTWIRLADSKWKEVWTTALAQDLPTWGSVPKVVECKTVPEQIKQATLKVIIPKAFQPPCDWDELCRKPASAVRTLLPEALSVRSYGWHLLEQRDEAICGFLKLPADKSPLVLANSGAKGFFVKRIDGQADPGQRVPIKWIPHNKLKAQAYFALAKREADKAKTSLAYRSGGGSCLGLIGIPAGENGSEAALLKRRWAAKNVPSSWSPPQLQQLLTSQGWRVISDIQAPARARGIWTFSAAPGSVEPSGQWFLKCGDDIGTIEIHAWQKRSTKPVSHPMRAAPAWVTRPQDPPQDGDKASTAHATTAAENGDEVQPTMFDASLPDSAGEIDMDEKRGNAMRQGAVSSKVQEKIAKVALSLRTKATDWLKNNQGAWVLEWYSDAECNEQTEAGAIPQDASEYLQACRRPAKWLDPWLTMASAHVLQVEVLVFKHLHGKWKFLERVVPRHSVSSSPLMLFLKDKHFYTLPSSETPPEKWDLICHVGSNPLLMGATPSGVPVDLPGSFQRSQAGPPSDDGYVEGPKNGVAPPKVDGRRALLSSETLVPSLLLGSAQLTRLVTVGSSGGDVKNRVSATRGPRVQSKMDSATKRKVREAKIAKKKAFQGWKHSESSSSRPQVGTHGLQLTEVEAPAKGAKLLWWVCPIPNCGFQVHRIVGQQGHSQTKDIHLRKAHGMAKAFPLTKAVSLQNTHNRLLKAREGQNLKWTAFIKTFNKRRWKGSHHIEVEPSLYKPAKIKDGSTIHVPWHKCQACGVLVNRSWLQHVWNACQAVGKQAVKALSCGLCKGLNGQRIGEAQNPGPAHPRMITIWNQNIASWNQNEEAVLKTALDDNIQLNLSDAALSGARNTARRSGWEMYVARQTGKRRGGVAICVREPLGVSEVKSECAAQFQFLRATVHGAASPVTVICGYRVPDEDTGFLEALNTLVQGASCHDWIVCLDGNQNQLEGPIHDLLSTERASIAAVARHNRSVHPIDAIWVCERLQVSCSSELPGLGDHSIASCTLQVSFQKGPRAWRMAKTRAYKPLDPSSGDQQGPAPQWPLSACSLDASPSVESKWRLWSQAAEEWLVLSKCVPQERSERPLGSMPKLRTAAHAAGLAQSLEERQIRRILRRFREAHVQSWRSNAVDPGLVKKLLRTPLQAEERQAVAQGRWGLAVSLAQKRLRAQLAKGQAKALTEWKHRVHSLSGAASWIKSEGPTSQCIQNAEGQVFSNRPAAAGALKDHWGTIFGVHQPADTYCEAFQQKYGDFLRPRSPGLSLPPIGAQELKASLKKMKGKAAGLDGFTPDCLLSLPEAGLSQLADVLNHCESEGQWPESLTQWRLVFLPKGKGICPSLDETRPIAISSAIYRAWGRLRLLQLSNHLARALQPWQAGGSKGVDPEVLLLATEVDFPGETYSHGVALDDRKAFDSLDYPLAIIGLRAMGVPSTVLDLLENQWKRQVRWVTFAGVVCPEPLELCAGLPQGDPWSPLGLAAVLAAPKQDAARQAPGTECLLYLDDRTLLSTSRDSLRIALDTWGELEQVSRMRTNESKTQFFCRSPNSADTADVLGASLGSSDRPLTQKEQKRKDKAASVASRIALLPVSLKMRANLCATVFSPIAAWACLLNGREPKAAELSWYTETFRRAVKGGDAKGDRSSRDLQRLLLLGHTADLSVVAACRVLKAAARWASYKLRLGHRPQRAALMSARPVKALDASLPAPWKRSGSWGRWTNGQVSWNILAESTEQQRAAHEVRESWRLVRLQRWLAANRNDARDARSEGLQASNALVKRLRTIAGQVDGHGVSIMCGGFAPDARWTPAGPVRDMCYSCMQSITPHTRHVLWNCVAHAHLRTVSVPASLLAQRLGWGSLDVPVQECVRTLQVMARIRAADVAGRRKRPPWREG
ncbi:unnamed protein product [Symbiodinium sp. CCMP2592]|nr:unnamed protein product [Symbiodinium sp. CCMP2592]